MFGAQPLAKPAASVFFHYAISFADRTQAEVVARTHFRGWFLAIARGLVYSVRSAFIGSIRDALHAGIKQASAATTSMDAVTDAKIAGSSGRVP
jgi:hypothetical protein